MAWYMMRSSQTDCCLDATPVCPMRTDVTHSDTGSTTASELQYKCWVQVKSYRKQLLPQLLYGHSEHLTVPATNSG